MSKEAVDELLVEAEPVVGSDRILNSLGYKAEFRREMSLFGVLGISFCAIGILTGMSSAFQTGLFSGGPLGLFWGWNVRISPHRRTTIFSLFHSDLQCVYALNCLVLSGNMQCIVS